MYRTRIFLIWALIVLVEMVGLFMLNWMNVYVPRSAEQAIGQKVSVRSLPLSVIRVRSHFNYGVLAILVALGDVVVFAILHYGEMLEYGFGGQWFGHLIIIFVIFWCYAFLCLFLLMAVFFGEDWKRSALKVRFREKYHVNID